MKNFQSINKGYNSVFKPNQLSIGIIVPIENYDRSPVPTMKHHLQRVQLIEQLGFKALWIRDVPFNVPTFGDAGQTFDPFTYLGYLAGQTTSIALGVGSIALPLHHPAHVAKSAATIDQLSDGRLILGVASGDRFEEYPAMNIDYEQRGALFRAAFEYIRKAQAPFPVLANNPFGELKGDIDLLPKATGPKIPLLLTGYSRQSIEWNAEHSDGWINYPRNFYMQETAITEWRDIIAKTQEHSKPFMHPLYVILEKEDDFKPVGIKLGLRIGINYLIDYLQHAKSIGVNHVALNLRFHPTDMEAALERLAVKVLPHFHSTKKETLS